MYVAAIGKSLSLNHPFTLLPRFLLMLLLFPVVTVGQEVRLSASVDSTNYLIGDWISVEIAAEHPYEVNVLWKNPVIRDTGVFEKISESKIDSIEQKGFLSENKTFVLTTYDTGILRIPSFTYYYEENGEVDSATTRPLTVYVSTVATDTASSFHSIKPVAEVKVRSFNRWWYVGGASLLFIVAFIFYMNTRMKKASKPATSEIKDNRLPYEIALDQLNELERSNYWKSGETKEYYMKLTLIIREYIERGLDIDAMENTTHEIVRSLRKKIDDKDLIEQSGENLLLADFVKFAKARPPAEENLRVLMQAKEFVEKTRALTIRQPEVQPSP